MLWVCELAAARIEVVMDIKKTPDSQELRVSGLLFDANRASSDGACRTRTTGRVFQRLWFVGSSALFVYWALSGLSSSQFEGSDSLMQLPVQGTPFILTLG
jgi:hypothetical protein